MKGAGCVILCTPSHAVEAMTESLVPWLEKDTVVVCASKGLADHAGHRLSEVIKDKVKGITKKIVVLSGPNHAEAAVRDRRRFRSAGSGAGGAGPFHEPGLPRVSQ